MTNENPPWELPFRQKVAKLAKIVVRWPILEQKIFYEREKANTRARKSYGAAIVSYILYAINV